MRVVPLPPDTYHALAAGDLAAANRVAPVELTPYFVNPRWLPGWGRASTRVRAEPRAADWLAGAVAGPDGVVGRAGYHGPPDEQGVVEVTYEIEPAWRRRGFARAALAELVARAVREPEVRVVRAVIRPHNTVSQRLVVTSGFTEVDGPPLPDGPWLVFERVVR
ncbi:GNAT family N-acetyltransferase [Amycolatopsis thermoflava]|uniref:RimJ/RimL family protein N-acetyltransferase n=1 Tax=Amycolatopsis thermoflava TaxID=84480 RepID=A0A3N2GU51_9PSEU|nr:GNAT family N-acetyltransferase [Amycolatopsis thermoflava]ROS39669.1 RimJ/RimL family protein N-acetyltransferase [Amycolatopsis thermoflava]